MRDLKLILMAAFLLAPFFAFAGIPEPPQIIWGRIFDADGLPAAGNTVVVSFTPSGGGTAVSKSATSTADGGYKVMMPMETAMTGYPVAATALPAGNSPVNYTRQVVALGVGMVTATVPVSATNIGTAVRVDIGTAALEQYHSGDTTRDFKFSVSEMIRMKQVYRETANHAYHCDASGGELDGYSTGEDPLAQGCTPHSGDYNPQDWQFSVGEMVRLMQFFNSTPDHAYCTAPLGEDGFRVGACDVKKLPDDKSADPGAEISGQCYAAGLYQDGVTMRLAVKLVWESSEGAPVVALGYEAPLPEGWSYQGEEQGSRPELRPHVGDGGGLGFVWQNNWTGKGACQGMFSFVLEAPMPLDTETLRSLAGSFIYRVAGMEGEKRTAIAFTADMDGDGIPDAEEGSVDLDGDGIPDVAPGMEDVDGDGIPNLLDWDSDGDRVSDADERAQGTDPYALQKEEMPLSRMIVVVLLFTLTLLGTVRLAGRKRACHNKVITK